MPADKNMEAMREKYLELQMLGEHLKQLEAQLEATTDKRRNALAVRQSLDELSKAEKGSESLVPIADGIFAKAQLGDTSTLVVNVGADVCVEKNIPETREILESRLAQIEEHREKLKEKMRELATMAETLERELAQMAGTQ